MPKMLNALSSSSPSIHPPGSSARPTPERLISRSSAGRCAPRRRSRLAAAPRCGVAPALVVRAAGGRGEVEEGRLQIGRRLESGQRAAHGCWQVRPRPRPADRAESRVCAAASHQDVGAGGVDETRLPQIEDQRGFPRTEEQVHALREAPGLAAGGPWWRTRALDHSAANPGRSPGHAISSQGRFGVAPPVDLTGRSSGARPTQTERPGSPALVPVGVGERLESAPSGFRRPRSCAPGSPSPGSGDAGRMSGRINDRPAARLNPVELSHVPGPGVVFRASSASGRARGGIPCAAACRRNRCCATSGILASRAGGIEHEGCESDGQIAAKPAAPGRTQIDVGAGDILQRAGAARALPPLKRSARRSWAWALRCSRPPR
jgi:hypothetical protein